MTIHVKDGGTWKEASLYVRDGGTWKAVNEGYIKDAGTWKQFFMNRVSASITISADTANYVLNTAKVSGYVAGKTDVTLTINSGVTIYSASTGSYAFNVDTSWTTGDTITIINNGTILGKGGAGNGNSGGGALYVQRAVSINNVNRIAGGGGGGGIGGNIGLNYLSSSSGGCGGGGGIGNGAGGSGASTSQGTSPSGSSGTLIAAGGGGSPGNMLNFSCQIGETSYDGVLRGGAGGSGGSYGASGSSGGAGTGGPTPCYGGTWQSSAGSGGAGGAAVAGNSNITWIATGTRNGGIS